MMINEVIPIYETSINFKGYIAQAFKYLPKDYQYYIFCGDDLTFKSITSMKIIL